MSQIELTELGTNDFIELMRQEKISRAFIVTDPTTGAVNSSHPALQPLGDWVARADDYRAHQGCFFEIGAASEHLLSAAVHLTVRGQAAGGVRFWTYDTVGAFITDGLRLSLGMGQKNALAGLWWGGGKGVIGRRPDRDHLDPRIRADIYRDYGRFVSGLRGCYVTAEDVGTTPEDMARVFETTRYTTCIPGERGGSGNPGVLTARGVVVAIEAALESLGLGSIAGKTVAIQGLGNVSLHTIGVLLERGVERIVGVDIDLGAVQTVEDAYGGAPLDLRVVSREDRSVFSEPCEVFVPNAVGATLNPETIPLLRTRIVCGAANNQLASSPRDARALQDRGILYVPDFLANRMGIVNCSNEQYGIVDNDAAIEAHLDRDAPQGIYRRCLEVLSRAERSGRTPAEEAEALAEELSAEPHPIWGNRGQLIINSLVSGNWAKADPLP